MKNLLFSGFMALLFSAMLANCKKSDEPGSTFTTRLGDTVEIAYQQTAKFEPEGFQIKFNSVVFDNRCPLDVNCIVAGHVDALLDFTLGKQKEQDVLRLGDQLDERSDNIEVMGYKVKLVQVLPYPQSNTDIPQADYKIRVVVVK